MRTIRNVRKIIDTTPIIRRFSGKTLLRIAGLESARQRQETTPKPIVYNYVGLHMEKELALGIDYGGKYTGLAVVDRRNNSVLYADHLGLHFASVSRIMRIRATMLKI